MTDLSVILPAYNDEEVLLERLPDLLAFLGQTPHTFEVIVVDDGSRRWQETERAALENGCQFLRHATNQGKGAAVRKGMLAAEGRYRIFMDGDLPFGLPALEDFYRYLDFKEFHLVVGDRNLEESEYFEFSSPLRRLASTVFTFLVGRFVTTGMFDTQCGMKGFRAEIAEDLFGKGRIEGFAFDVELLYIALKRNYDIKRLPVRLRRQEQSSVRVLYHGLGMLRDVLRIRVNQLLGRYRKGEGRP